MSQSKIALFLLIVVALLQVSGCHSHTTPPANESIIVDNPWFFGHGGVRENTQKPGLSWYWATTSLADVSISPIKYDEPLEHLSTADNNFINYNSYIVLQWEDNSYNATKFGMENWYENNLQQQYRTIVRDVTKKYQMTAIMTDPVTLKDIEGEISNRFSQHISTTGLRVKLINVNMGKALPNQSVITEMDNTAAQQQRQKTEVQRKLAEDSRFEAEKSRAHADNAYREEMKLDAGQFVQLESVKRYSEACIKSSSCVIVQGNTPVMLGAK